MIIHFKEVGTVAILITMEATVDTMVDTVTVTVTGINFFLFGVFIVYD